MKHIFSFLVLLLLIQPLAAQQNVDTKKETRLIFVRHAEKMDDGTRNPHLSDKGKVRANRLASILQEDFDITTIYSTDYYRTMETADPLAEQLGLSVRSYGLQNPDSLMNDILKLHDGEDILIVGHSNTTPNLVNIVLGEPRFEQLDESDYSNIFVVLLREDEFRAFKHLTY
ncbi:MAG: phosphoglycerate mutase family protein [Gracilimonas sp.]|nr:phosphoglycerate mutase family protein [Gracilimonas sp.]